MQTQQPATTSKEKGAGRENAEPSDFLGILITATNPTLVGRLCVYTLARLPPAVQDTLGEAPAKPASTGIGVCLAPVLSSQVGPSQNLPVGVDLRAGDAGGGGGAALGGVSALPSHST